MDKRLWISSIKAIAAEIGLDLPRGKWSKFYRKNYSPFKAVWFSLKDKELPCCRDTVHKRRIKNRFRNLGFGKETGDTGFLSGEG